MTSSNETELGATPTADSGGASVGRRIGIALGAIAGVVLLVLVVSQAEPYLE